MIVCFDALSGAERAEALTALERIFFACSLRQSFSSAKERAAFFATWVGCYLRCSPADIILWRDPQAGEWAGYLTGRRDSAGAADLSATIPAYDRFADLFAVFPAHLHVNVDTAFRGRGVGAALVGAFAAACGTGVHIVTGAQARNRAFYRRCGFTFEETRGGLLLMGRNISDYESTLQG